MNSSDFQFRGKAFIVGDNVDTDAIINANWLILTDEKELASHCLEDVYPGFDSKVSKGDILVAGDNFGCGSSREHAPLAIMGCGISCVVARSFSRLFYRNAINIGLPVVTADAASYTVNGDGISADCETGKVVVYQTSDSAKDDGGVIELSGEPLPEFMLEILRSGSLYGYLEKSLVSQGKL